MLEFEYDCTNLKNTCKNACWHTFCGNNDIGILHWDSDHADEHRKASGVDQRPCKNKDLPYGDDINDSAEEFPFASTAEGGEGASLRCISKKEQRRQGGLVGDWVKKNKPAQGQAFKLFLKKDSYNDIPVCVDPKKNCFNDGKQFTFNHNTGQFELQSAKFIPRKRDDGSDIPTEDGVGNQEALDDLLGKHR
ncbi:MAG: hypothetical protein M1830_005319 [Pleopsidium flavum]|nr:MAG: hypothetical protein M1830_005319 [Pleopsidium flavum]